MNPYLTIIFACLCNAQFAFRLEDTDATSLYMDLQAMWADWAAAGNQVLESASAEGLTDAWSLLASIYGATSIPALYNDAMARNAASALAGAQSTTVWDPDAGDHAQYSFAVRSISTNNEFGSADETPTAPAATAFVTSAITVSGVSSSTTSSTSSSTSTSVSSGVRFHERNWYIGIATAIFVALCIHM